MNREHYARRAMKKRRRSRRLGVICGCLTVIVLLTAFAATRHGKECVLEEVFLEAGREISADLFLTRQTEEAVFLTGASEIDTAVPGTYPIEIKVNGVICRSRLTIQDTVAPAGAAVPVTVRLGDAPPEASAFVGNIYDVTPVTATFDNIPDFTAIGRQQVTVLLTDTSGNTARVTSTLTVLAGGEPPGGADTEAPVIVGPEEIRVLLGDAVSYRSAVTVTDNEDSNPTLEIDNSRVDLTKPGDYPVIYRATDAAGNSSEKMILVRIEKSSDAMVAEIVYNLAREVLSEITDESMDDMQVAYAIYRWAKSNISYVNTSDKSSWISGAYQAFTQRRGDCFNYFAAAKALLTAAGIENADIVKSDTSHSRHFWNLVNLGDGWYHFDCTPRKGEGDDFFLVTDEELEAYSGTHNNSHVFDPSLYPERSTVSVQDQIDYSAKVLRR